MRRSIISPTVRAAAYLLDAHVGADRPGELERCDSGEERKRPVDDDRNDGSRRARGCVGTSGDRVRARAAARECRRLQRPRASCHAGCHGRSIAGRNCVVTRSLKRSLGCTSEGPSSFATAGPSATRHPSEGMGIGRSSSKSSSGSAAVTSELPRLCAARSRLVRYHLPFDAPTPAGGAPRKRHSRKRRIDVVVPRRVDVPRRERRRHHGRHANPV